MRGAIPPLPNTSLWCGALLSRGTTFLFLKMKGDFKKERTDILNLDSETQLV